MVTSAIFQKKIGSRTHSDPKFGWRGGVSYINVMSLIQNTVPACVTLRKNFQNGVLARSVTKVPLIVTNMKG
jgi:hypothetical protein